MTIYCQIKLDPEEKIVISDLFEKEDLIFSDELEGDQLGNFNDSDICFGNIDPLWIKDSKKLKWVQLESVGFAPYLILPNTKIPPITNLKGFFAIPVAETALAGILSLYRGINTLDNLKAKQSWQKDSVRKKLRTLDSAKILILGAGSIAMHLKKLLSIFGCEVTLFAKDQKDDETFPIDDLNNFLISADIIIGCLPETSETINLLNAQRLNLLSSDAIVVNVGRGSLLDENVLIDKLTEGSLAGAVLDVIRREPLPKDHPLWNCPNTILTQHTGGGMKNETLGKINFFYDNYKLFIKDKELINSIDLNKGY